MVNNWRPNIEPWNLIRPIITKRSVYLSSISSIPMSLLQKANQWVFSREFPQSLLNNIHKNSLKSFPEINQCKVQFILFLPNFSLVSSYCLINISITPSTIFCIRSVYMCPLYFSFAKGSAFPLKSLRILCSSYSLRIAHAAMICFKKSVNISGCCYMCFCGA